MKHFIFLLCVGMGYNLSVAQCDAPVIIAEGPTQLSCPACSVKLSAAPGNTWVQRAAVGNTARSGAVGFSIGLKGYVGTGSNEAGGYLSDIWEYDPSTQAWTQKADFPGRGRTGAVGFSIDSYGYIGTGIGLLEGQAIKYNDFWKFNPTSNSWNKIRSLDYDMERAFATGLSIYHKGYIGLGINRNNTLLKDFWQYNPETDLWVRKKDFEGEARQSAIGFYIESRTGSRAGIKIERNGYIGTGMINDGTFMKDFWKYDPILDTWTMKRDFGGVARQAAVGFSIGAKGYIATGMGGNDIRDFNKFLLKDSWEYDPATDAWVQKSDVGGSYRHMATGFSIGSKGFVGTGSNLRFELKNDFWEYDPGYAYTWITHQEPTPSDYSTSITVQSGEYQVSATNALGCTSTSGIVKVRNYIPPKPVTVVLSGPANVCSGSTVTLSASSGNVWTQKEKIPKLEKSSAVSFSINGIGYFGTGTSRVQGANDGFWSYDPLQKIWTQKAAFRGGQRYGASAFSIGDKGYIGTGKGDSVLYKNFWMYDPKSNAWTRKADFGGTPRYFAVGFSIGTKGYIGTGNDGQMQDDFWEYDPFTDSWTPKASFKGMAREGATGFSIDGNGFIGTGRYYDRNSYDPHRVADTSYFSDFYKYNQNIDRWERMPAFMGTARAFATAFSIGNKGYIGTGTDGEMKKDLWEYNNNNSEWTEMADFGGTARAFATSFSIGSKGYTCSGNDGYDLGDLWEYDPGYYYTWLPGGQQGASLTVSTTGIYSVTGTNALGGSTTSDAVNVTVYPSGIAYVDSSRTTSGDGSSWTNAFRELRDALAVAGQCSNITSIYIAKGTYKPAAGSNRDSAFVILQGGLKLYGGYPPGGGTRNVNSYPTVLSGNIGNPKIKTDNSFHVLVIAGVAAGADSVVVDGLTVRDGQADVQGSNNLYGGITLWRNSGAGISLQSNSLAQKLVLRNLTITRNYSVNVGGGMLNAASSPLLTNCNFLLNTSSNGGGIRNENYALPVLINCVFANNVAPAGGGISNDNCPAKIVNCIFTSNNASTYGGAILNWNNSSTAITNCTFFNNTSALGGDLYNYASYPVITNSIVWGSTAGIYNAGGAVMVSYSTVQGGASGTGNWQIDPAFTNAGDPDGADNIFGTPDDGLYLTSTSLAINRGNNLAVNLPQEDITARPRVVERVDMGAYEYQIVPAAALKSMNSSSEASGMVVPQVRETKAPLKIYPVPAKDAVWLNSSISIGGWSNIVLMDVQGHVLRAIHITQWPHRIDISSLAPGTYLIKAPDGIIGKFIKQ